MIQHSLYRLFISLVTITALVVGLASMAYLAAPVSADVGGCPIFPANNVWNARVDSLPVHANSGNYIASMGNAGLHPDFGSGDWDGGPIGIPYTTVMGDQPRVPIHYVEYGNESDPGPFPIPTDAPREWGSDHHVLVVNTDDCTLYELYHAAPNADGSWNAGSGATWDLNSNALRRVGWTSADAAGLSILAGLVRRDEVPAGEILHALRFTVNCTEDYIWPARHRAAHGSCAHPAPMGLRVRLKADVDISGFSQTNQVILTALKQYGMFVADNGSNWYLTGAPHPDWDNDDLHELQNNIHGYDFQVVDESGWIIDPNSGQVGGTPSATPYATVAAPSVTLSPTPSATPSSEPRPTSTRSSPKLGGCPVFSANSIFNTPIDTLPVDANSDAYIASIGAGTGLHPDFGSGKWDGSLIGIPFNLVASAQPLLPVTFQYADQSDRGPYPIPTNPKIEGGSDRHLLMVQRQKCKLYELFAARRTKNGKWRAGSGAIWELRSNTLRPATWTSADAAGLPVTALVVKYNEVAAGEIKHALRFTASETRREFIWPARHYASDITNEDVPPMGQRFRLKAVFDVSPYPPRVQVILNALKKYGMFLADNGSDWYISGAPDERWDNDELHVLGEIRGSDFEAVDESGLMVDPDSGEARLP